MVNRVVLLDLLGFGFSEKPTDCVYSLFDQAELLLEFCRLVGLERVHVVGHDMGDSVLTQALSILQRGFAPQKIDELFQTITFTNGGMVYEMIDQTLGQKILIAPFNIGHHFVTIVPKQIKDAFTHRTLTNLWMNTDAEHDSEDSISAIMQLIEFNGGDLIMDKLQYYLKERQIYQSRWFRSLKLIKVPVRYIWSDSDPVSTVNIPYYISSLTNNEENVIIVKNGGHFWMLERPSIWLEYIKASFNI
eukprot:TRINITY_DN12450_c0_g1_i1.p1 TRINITY_DN12450_c0_g1~~TRINITY_DN12450_c0_g1_i1.p1  ORF type:complete len:247 (-),score=32.65 TRINITY_DN12450_c0_g1_i1:68-808(-)